MNDATLHMNNINPFSAKGENSDLDQLAYELKLSDSPPKKDIFRSKFETNSAIISSFKSPESRTSTFLLNQRSLPKEEHTIRSPTHGDKNSAGYEYLCRVQAIKNWLEKVLEIQIQQTSLELLSYIRNGIYLAKLANKFLPTKRIIYTNDTKLDFRHTENINAFFHLLEHLKIPSVFYFELTDLFDSKDIPKVLYCLHALSYKISTIDSSCPLIQNLVGTLEFTSTDISSANRSLHGRQLPGFSSIDLDIFGSPVKSGFFNKALNLSPAPKTSYGQSLSMSPSPKRNITSLSFTPSRATDDNGQSPISSRKVIVDSGGSPIKNMRFEHPSREILSNLQKIIMIQTLSRGSLLRYNIFVDRIMLRSFDPELSTFVSIIRGYLFRRKSVHGHRKEILLFKDNVINLQSISRGYLQRLSMNEMQTHESFDTFKAILKGNKVRARYHLVVSSLNNCQDQIIQLQSITRQAKAKKLISVIIKNKVLIEPFIISLQSHVRGLLHRHQLRSLDSKCNGLSHFQDFISISRGTLARNRIREILRQFYYSQKLIIEFQSVLRGAISRTKLCNGVLSSLSEEYSEMNKFRAQIRAIQVRNSIRRTECSIRESKDQIRSLQSKFRGVLFRYELDLKCERLYDSVDMIIELQSLIRAKPSRTLIKDFNFYYQKNLLKVIEAQALIRGIIAQAAYKSFVNMRNPPLSVIRKFAYLLVDQNQDISEDSNFGEYKDKILELSRLNEELEVQIDHLDTKLDLLDKNLISTDEFIQQRAKIAAINPSNKLINCLQKEKLQSRSIKKKLELYLSLFYILQTNPLYLCRYLDSLRTQSQEEAYSFEDLTMALYPAKSTFKKSRSREEYFFVKFLFLVLKADYSQSVTNIADITKAKKCLWIRIFTHYNNYTQNRKILGSIFGHSLKLLWDDESTTFESDPVVIYSRLRNKELKIHGKSKRIEKIQVSQAIADSAVSEEFIKNLMHLRDYTTEFMTILKNNVSKLPVHVRLIAKETYHLSKMNFPSLPDSMHLSVAGVLVVKYYLSTILLSPELFGLKRRLENSKSDNSKNLVYLSKVVLQIFSMRPFKDNFMKPLNEFVLSYSIHVKALMRDLINVEDISTVYEVNEFLDLVAEEKPKLVMSVQDIISFDKLVTNELLVFAPNSDDQLRELVDQMNSISCTPQELVQFYGLGTCTLLLVPASTVDTLSVRKTKLLMSQAKLYLTHLISIQEGDDLLELLIHGITSTHEEIFASSNSSRLKDLDKPYLPDGIAAENLLCQTLAVLKQKLLKTILELEKMNVINRENSYQDLLNEIVLDIKTKRQQRELRKKQLQLSVEAITSLERKRDVLKSQLIDYNKHIEHMLETLQLKPKERKFLNIIPVFSRQYFYQRKLRRNNCLPKFGSYIHSYKKLMDLGVLTRISKSYNGNGINPSKLEFKFSCHSVGVFTIEVALLSVNIRGACRELTLDEVLDRQQEKLKEWPLFDKLAYFDTDNLASLIFRNFYEANT